MVDPDGSIERPVTVDTAIDRLFLPCRGALLYSASARTDLQGGGNLVRERSTRGYPTQRSPSFELIREVPAGLNPTAQGGHGPITPRSLGRCEPGEFHAPLPDADPPQPQC